jgi:hypothetical protein
VIIINIEIIYKNQGMKSIKTNIVKNSYIRPLNGDELPIPLLLFDKTLKTFDKTLNLNRKEYCYAHIICDPIWLRYTQNDNLDLFKFISDKVVHQIRKKKCYFIFDASEEGFSPFLGEWNFFPILYRSIESQNIDPSQIIFMSSNLKDEINIENYCRIQNKEKINVFSLPLFDYSCRVDGKVNELFNQSILKTANNYKEKYFSSLSRRNRFYRSIGTFLLCQSPIKDKGLLSHDKIEKNDTVYKSMTEVNEFDQEKLEKWIETLPLVIDYNDFNVNWGLQNIKFDHIHDQTIFQIVNETHVHNFNNTSMFYSEKTFRPISCFQPFLIWGQKGCNQYLRYLGYKTYEEWFDLSFDNEEDNILRYKKLLTIVEDTCTYLNSLKRDKQIEWKYKNKNILIHNFKVMNDNRYTVHKLRKFILNLEKQIK